MIKRLLINIAILIFTLLAIEVGLRFSGLLLSSMEMNGGKYLPQFNEKRDTWFHTWPPNSTINYVQDEFQYVYQINEWGNREKQISFFNDKKEEERVIKVACLGDSFTEGDGAPYDSTWVKSLEQLLNKKSDKKYVFYNAGNSGSDVFYNYIQLRERLLSLGLDYVIELINDSDINDVVYAGGLERFNEDGTVSYKTGRKWEILYAKSHLIRLVVRVVFGYDDLLIKKSERLDAVNKIINQITLTHNLCKENNIKYSAFFHLTPQNLRHKINFDSSLLDEKIDSLPFGISLSKPMLIKFGKTQPSEYSWEKNYHFNGKGYWELGQIIFQNLSDLNHHNTNDNY